jgi:hypothetical protein
MPRVKVGPIKGLKPGSAITKVVREAADRLYDAFLRDPNPGKRFGIFDRAYTKFVRETEREFEKMAAKIYRRWPLPEAVEPQDVVQDLHVEIVRIMRSYKPEKATVAAFLIWNAFARAKKECNRQRGKVKDRDPSIHALVVSGLLSTGESGPERFEDCIDRLALEGDALELDRECESMLDSKEMLRKIRSRLSEQDSRRVRRVVAHGGNVRAAAFDMISAAEEMDPAALERAVARKTKKLMAALNRAANVWNTIERHEQGNDEEDREDAGNEERQTEEHALDERREAANCAIGAAIRHRRSEARFRGTEKTQTHDRRNRTGANAAACFFLCA